MLAIAAYFFPGIFFVGWLLKMPISSSISLNYNPRNSISLLSALITSFLWNFFAAMHVQHQVLCCYRFILGTRNTSCTFRSESTQLCKSFCSAFNWWGWLGIFGIKLSIFTFRKSIHDRLAERKMSGSVNSFILIEQSRVIFFIPIYFLSLSSGW